MPGDGSFAIFMNFPEMVEGTMEASPGAFWEGGEWGDPQSDGGLGTLTSTGGGLTPDLPGSSTPGGATTGCTGSDWISLGYPTKQAWKTAGKSCAPYQGFSPASCSTGFSVDPASGQCMPIQPALPPTQVIPGTGGVAGWCQQIPAGQVGSCLSPISQGQIGAIPPPAPAPAGTDVLSGLEGIWAAHSTLILVGVGLFLLWPTLTKRRR